MSDADNAIQAMRPLHDEFLHLLVEDGALASQYNVENMAAELLRSRTIIADLLAERAAARSLLVEALGDWSNALDERIGAHLEGHR